MPIPTAWVPRSATYRGGSPAPKVGYAGKEHKTMIKFLNPPLAGRSAPAHARSVGLLVQGPNHNHGHWLRFA